MRYNVFFFFFGWSKVRRSWNGEMELIMEKKIERIRNLICIDF